MAENEDLIHFGPRIAHKREKEFKGYDLNI
jgi:hypothetical protein